MATDPDDAASLRQISFQVGVLQEAFVEFLRMTPGKGRDAVLALLDREVEYGDQMEYPEGSVSFDRMAALTALREILSSMRR